MSKKKFQGWHGIGDASVMASGFPVCFINGVMKLKKKKLLTRQLFQDFVVNWSGKLYVNSHKLLDSNETCTAKEYLD